MGLSSYRRACTGVSTSPVRALSVVARALAHDTSGMTGDRPATTFITGAAGFIGIELIKVLKARGHDVYGLTWSLDAAERVRKAGATAVMGNLLEPGQWQDEAAADWVFHLPPHPQEGGRITWTRAAAISRERMLMDAHLLDAVAAGATQRVVYVADTSCYGSTGPRPITEDRLPQSSAWGRCLGPAFSRLEGYVAAGLPIVTAFPGWVYGNGSWFRKRVIEPVIAGRHVLQFGKTGPWVSPIHVHDCARALVHLAERGEVGGRYFLVNSRSDPDGRVRGYIRPPREPSVARLALTGSRAPVRRRARAIRFPESRRGVLQRPTARPRLPVPVSHARAGTRASPRSAP